MKVKSNVKAGQSGDNVYERVFITGPLLPGSTSSG